MRSTQRADLVGVARRCVRDRDVGGAHSVASTKPRLTSSPPKSSSCFTRRALLGQRERVRRGRRAGRRGSAASRRRRAKRSPPISGCASSQSCSSRSASRFSGRRRRRPRRPRRTTKKELSAARAARSRPRTLARTRRALGRSSRDDAGRDVQRARCRPAASASTPSARRQDPARGGARRTRPGEVATRSIAPAPPAGAAAGGRGPSSDQHARARA